MNIPTILVVMAGGSGERYWPLSRIRRPKQLLRLTHETKSMLEEALERVNPLIPYEHSFIAANRILRDTIIKSIPQLPKENVLGEPFRRNTSGCLAFAAAHALARYEENSDDILMAVLTADHRIGHDDQFRQTIAAALQYAGKHDSLGVIGITPTRPETGYGYIEIAEGTEPLPDEDGVKAYPVAQFREKPERELAERFLSTGRFYWNSGMFFWRVSVFMAELERVMPQLAQHVRDMRDILKTSSNPDPEIEAIFEQMENVSIDYALMEHASSVFMVRGRFIWDDVGSWDSLARVRPKDENGNVALGDPILVDCHDVTVYNEAGAEKMAVGVIGMENIVVITTDDGLLICPKNRLQEVRKIVECLKERDANQI